MSRHDLFSITKYLIKLTRHEHSYGLFIGVSLYSLCSRIRKIDQYLKKLVCVPLLFATNLTFADLWGITPAAPTGIGTVLRLVQMGTIFRQCDQTRRCGRKRQFGSPIMTNITVEVRTQEYQFGGTFFLI